MAPLITGDVLPALQMAREHAHETDWQAVRLARPNMRPWTAVRLGKRVGGWRPVVVFSRLTAGRISNRGVQYDRLILIRRGSHLNSPLLQDNSRALLHYD